MATNTTRKFATTLNSSERINKIDTRNKLLEMCLSVISLSSNILTLPSIYWEFERLLLPHIKNMELNIYSFEYDWKLFCVSCLQIPKSRSSSIKQIMNDLNHQEISVNYHNNTISLHHVDVFDYLRHCDTQFDFMWIDLISPVDHIKDDISFIADKLSDRGVCVLSFLKGREREKISDRIEYVKNILTDMEIINSFEYTDTITMINIVLKKKINYENLIAL